MSRFRRVSVTLLAAVVLAFAVSVPASAALSAKFTLYMKVGFCFSGKGPANAQASVEWRSSTGGIKSSFMAQSDVNGYFFPPDLACQQNRVALGDRIKVTFASQVLSRTLVVPPLTIRFDRSTNVVRGKAPANGSVHLLVSRFPVGGNGFPILNCEGDVASGANARYQVDATTLGGSQCPADYDPVGGDIVELYWRSNDFDTVILEGYAHFVRVAIGSAAVAGAVDAGQDLSIDERGPGGLVRGEIDAVGNAWEGRFQRTLRNASGNPAKVRSGDRVSGDWAGPVSFVVPTLSITWNVGDNSARGRCMRRVVYQIVVHRGSSTYSVSGRTNDAGLTGVARPQDPVVPGDTATLTCARKSGDAIRLVSVLD